MNVYAIHKERIWTTEYNVAICSSKKLAEKTVQELNEKYYKWIKEMNYLYENNFLGESYMDFVYSNPKPPKYCLEKLKVIKKNDDLSRVPLSKSSNQS
jgi:hypothetical protein